MLGQRAGVTLWTRPSPRRSRRQRRRYLSSGGGASKRRNCSVSAARCTNSAASACSRTGAARRDEAVEEGWASRLPGVEEPAAKGPRGGLGTLAFSSPGASHHCAPPRLRNDHTSTYQHMPTAWGGPPNFPEECGKLTRRRGSPVPVWAHERRAGCEWLRLVMLLGFTVEVFPGSRAAWLRRVSDCNSRARDSDSRELRARSLEHCPPRQRRPSCRQEAFFRRPDSM